MTRRERMDELRERAADPEKLHAHQHALIDASIVAFRDTPRRSGLDHHRRREAYKGAIWNLAGHLRQMHGWRGRSLGKGIEDLQRIHEDLHSPG